MSILNHAHHCSHAKKQTQPQFNFDKCSPPQIEKTKNTIQILPTDYAHTEETESKILSFLTDKPIFIDDIVKECHKPIHIIQQHLVELELEGKIIRHPGNYISRDFSN